MRVEVSVWPLFWSLKNGKHVCWVVVVFFIKVGFDWGDQKCENVRNKGVWYHFYDIGLVS